MMWKELNYYYAWKIPLFYDEKLKNAKNTIEKKGAIWINTQSYEVIGAKGNIELTKE